MTKEEKLEKWAKIYKEWEESKEIQKEYCCKRGLSYSTFKSMIGFVKPPRSKRNEDKKESGFEEIKIRSNTAIEPSRPYCKVEFSDKGAIHIETKESFEAFKQLLGIQV